MELRENIPLSLLTTLKVGGTARYVSECFTEADIRSAIEFSKREEIPFSVLGEGSNILAPDEGYTGLVIHIRIPGIEFNEDTQVLSAGAGVIWDELVTQAELRELWGLENLAGIPGTVGASPVQNIGAYGAEVADTLSYVEAFNANTGLTEHFTPEECGFGYRESRFKREKNLIITKVGFRLTRDGAPRIAYKDLVAEAEKGAQLTTPKEIGAVVRVVRSRKFPNLQTHGTAGSFFKNPIITRAHYEELLGAYPEMPNFPVSEGVKIPLAWILDNVLMLKGFSMNHVALFERQPLVLVTEAGAHASDVETLAAYVTEKVFDATKIKIEREVRSLM